MNVYKIVKLGEQYRSPYVTRLIRQHFRQDRHRNSDACNELFFDVGRETGLIASGDIGSGIRFHEYDTGNSTPCLIEPTDDTLFSMVALARQVAGRGECNYGLHVALPRSTAHRKDLDNYSSGNINRLTWHIPTYVTTIDPERRRESAEMSRVLREHARETGAFPEKWIKFDSREPVSLRAYLELVGYNLSDQALLDWVIR